MKKLYTTKDYKKRQKAIQIRRQKQNRRKKSFTSAYCIVSYEDKRKRSDIVFVAAPDDFRLLENTEECLRFFSDLRSGFFVQRDETNKMYVQMSLEKVEYIDYSAISVLTAISDDLGYNSIVLRGNFPIKEDCKIFIEKSGFLDRMRKTNGQPFNIPKKSKLLSFEKGTGKLSREDNVKINETVKSVTKHLLGQEVHYQSLRTMLLEICGNAIEWSEAQNEQWILGVQYEEEKVIVTVTDVGKGILKTLHRKNEKKFRDFVLWKSRDKILMGAFDKKYGSQSKKVNRNKGLPSIKKKFIDGRIEELKVITNNVVLHFDDPNSSYELKPGSRWFKGTFYRWVVTKDCITGDNNCNGQSY